MSSIDACQNSKLPGIWIIEWLSFGIVVDSPNLNTPIFEEKFFSNYVKSTGNIMENWVQLSCDENFITNQLKNILLLFKLALPNSKNICEHFRFHVFMKQYVLDT